MQRYAQLSNNTVVLVIESENDPDGINGEWVACGDAGPGWVFDGEAFHAPEPVPELRHITPLAFRRRFTKDERAAIEWAAVDRSELSNEQRMQAAALRSYLKDQAQASFIDLDDEELIAGVQTLELAGLIAAGRASEILSAPVLEGEKP